MMQPIKLCWSERGLKLVQGEGASSQVITLNWQQCKELAAEIDVKFFHKLMRDEGRVQFSEAERQTRELKFKP